MRQKHVLKNRKWIALSLTAAMLLTLLVQIPVMGATASSVQLMKTQGTVTVASNSGRALSVRDNMKLYNGYSITTKQKSYAWLKLDNTKLAKVDACSKVEFRKNKKSLELLIKSGNILFDVKEPLKSNETMNVRTSTLVAGIRGTFGWMEITEDGNTRLNVLEGSVECTRTDPESGESSVSTINSGESGEFSNGVSGGPLFEKETLTEVDVPGYVCAVLLEDSQLCQEIYEKSNLDLRDLTEEQVRKRLEADEKKTEEKLKEVERKVAGLSPEGAESGAESEAEGESESGSESESESEETEDIPTYPSIDPPYYPWYPWYPPIYYPPNTPSNDPSSSQVTEYTVTFSVPAGYTVTVGSQSYTNDSPSPYQIKVKEGETITLPQFTVEKTDTTSGTGGTVPVNDFSWTYDDSGGSHVLDNSTAINGDITVGLTENNNSSGTSGT